MRGILTVYRYGGSYLTLEGVAKGDQNLISLIFSPEGMWKQEEKGLHPGFPSKDY